jgi:hypothetical protein
MVLGLTSCEPRVYEPSGLPSEFIGNWLVEDNIFREVEFLENKAIVDMKNGSVHAKLEFFSTAKGDTLEFGFFENAMSIPPKGPYICTYYFENNNKLVIKGFNQVLYHGDLTLIVRDMEAEIILTRKK